MTGAGASGELLAARLLERAGLAIVERNFRTRYGEIDLVARDGDYLVFVEVRVRRTPGFGGAAHSITAAKQEKLRRAAAIYLARLHEEPACRFDAVLIESFDPPAVEWLRGAFE